MNSEFSIVHKNNQASTSSNKNIKSEQTLQEEEQFYPSEKSLCVCPLPTSISENELVWFFHQFGLVKRYRFRRNSFIIEYCDSKPVDILMSKTNWLSREKLCLRRKINDGDSKFPNKSKALQPRTKRAKQTPNNTEENADPINYFRINHVIENQVTFDSQMRALLNEIQLSDAELMGRYNVICPHLNEIFKSYFPECQTFRFGSTVTGLSFKECDLDLYMYIGRIGLPPVFNEPDVPPFVLTLSIIKKIRKIMFTMKFIFANIVPIPKARTPIIKFRYLPTNVSCDISFKNGLGIYKSNFLRYCAYRDVRLRPLMLLIKYWAKHLGISGTGKITNYGLMCLIIFYLQQKSVGLLPPLIDLQRNCVPQIINGWQVNFDENAVLPPINNNSSIPKLLHNFFFFYAKFDFNSHVLCLLDGKIYTKTDFAQVHALPDYLDKYKNYVIENNITKKMDRPLCVLDPIELYQNTGAITPERVLIAFQHCCTFSAEICATASANNYDNLLKTLFTKVPSRLTEVKKKKVISKNINPGRFLNVGLPENFEQREDIVDKEQYKKDNWFFIVLNLIRDIFHMVFKLKVKIYGFEVLNEETRKQKLEMLSDVHVRNYQKIMFHCIGSKCVWVNRKKNNPTLLDVQLSALEKEAITSDKVIEKLQGSKSNDNIGLDFTCVLEKMSHPVAINITMHNESNKKGSYQQFECFASSLIPKIIEKTLIHMLQYKKTYEQLQSNYNCGEV